MQCLCTGLGSNADCVDGADNGICAGTGGVARHVGQRAWVIPAEQVEEYEQRMAQVEDDTLELVDK